MNSEVLFIIWIITAFFSLTLNIMCLIVLRRCQELEIFLEKQEILQNFLCRSIFDLNYCRRFRNMPIFVIPAIRMSVSGDWPFGFVTCAIQVIIILPCYFGGVFSLLVVNIGCNILWNTQ